jgi:hypothetical protein
MTVCLGEYGPLGINRSSQPSAERISSATPVAKQIQRRAVIPLRSVESPEWAHIKYQVKDKDEQLKDIDAAGSLPAALVCAGFDRRQVFVQKVRIAGSIYGVLTMFTRDAPESSRKKSKLSAIL